MSLASPRLWLGLVYFVLAAVLFLSPAIFWHFVEHLQHRLRRKGEVERG